MSVVIDRLIGADKLFGAEAVNGIPRFSPGSFSAGPTHTQGIENPVVGELNSTGSEVTEPHLVAGGLRRSPLTSPAMETPPNVVIEDGGIPGVGAFVQIRHRLWLVEAVEPGLTLNESTLVSLSCIDDDAIGSSLTVLWEAEPNARIVAASGWQHIGAAKFDPPAHFGAFYRTMRWGCVTATDPTLFQAPFRSGIRLFDYQLEPLRKALLMPRVNQFIADDVGLGKTIEAGLILRELLLRRRVDTCVIAAPPGMLIQWQEEMEARFGLSFTIIDRDYVTAVRRQRGYAANPWQAGSRFLVSHRLLTDPAYRDGLIGWLGEFKPKSMLILDEAHHAAPASGSRYAIDSGFTHAIRGIAGRFEHRIFLSATPHNGHSNSFSALLAILDPQRFLRGDPVRRADREAVMVRRLKEDLRTIRGGFPERIVEQVDIAGLPQDAPELRLSLMLAELRELREARLAKGARSARQAGLLVLGTLQQRLLSSIAAFHRTIGVHGRALVRMTAAAPLLPTQSDMLLASPDADTPQSALEHLSEAEDEAVRHATLLSSAGPEALLAAERALVARMVDIADAAHDAPDERIAWLLRWISAEMLTADGRTWTGRRLLIFTEWEDTRRWLEGRLRRALERTDLAQSRIACFTGLTPQPERERLKRAFNTPPDRDPLRILIATDAAREGLNFQRACHDLLHFDLPWNPSRLEQRNGRIDRKLQPAPQVFCRYFYFPQRIEDRVLQVLVRKSGTIREELGSMAAVLESRVKDLLSNGIRHAEATVTAQRIQAVGPGLGRDVVDAELEEGRERQNELRAQVDRLQRQLDRSARAIALKPEQLRGALSASLALSGVAPIHQEAAPAADHPASFALPAAALSADASWQSTLDLLRVPRRPELSIAEWRATAPVRPVTFDDPGDLGEDAVQLHLEHRVVRRLLSRFTTQGLIHLDLSRACLAATRLGEPRVVLLGRLSLYGLGAARLHEEIVPVTARWTDPALRGAGLRPYGDAGETRTLDLLEEALTETPPTIAAEIRTRLLAALPRDIDELRPHLDAAAATARAAAETLLAQRGEREAEGMRRLLSDQRARITNLIRKAEPVDQLTLSFPDEAERRQVQDDRRAWDRRLDALAREEAEEPNRVRAGYATVAWRVEPVGIAYLWPATA